MILVSKNEHYEEYVRLKISRNFYMQFLGFDITKILPGHIEGILPFKKIHEQQNGFLHGAVTSALCDMACGFAAYSLVKSGDQVFTVEIKVSYFKPGIAEHYFALGKVIKPGKKFHFCEAEIYAGLSQENVLIAKASSTMAIVSDTQFSDKYTEQQTT